LYLSEMLVSLNDLQTLKFYDFYVEGITDNSKKAKKGRHG